MPANPLRVCPPAVWAEDNERRRDIVTAIRHVEAAVNHLRQAGSGVGRAHRILLRLAAHEGLLEGVKT